MTEKKQEKTIDSKTLEKIKGKVNKLIDNGSTLDHAISVVCRVNEFNPKTVRNMLEKKYHMEEDDEKRNYKDIKNNEGSYVMLKKNPEKQYEVININNKENITLVDLDDNSEIKVKEEDIIPIVTETKMNEKLNEAQYTVSIDNLETTDAETLSQMLSLAGQAEEPAVDEYPSPVEEPTVDDMGYGVAVDDVPVAEPVMDYEPTISAEMDGPGFEAAEVDSMPVVDAEEDVVLPAEDDMDEVTVPAEENEIIGEGVEGEEDLSEDVLVPSEDKVKEEDPTTAEKEDDKEEDKEDDKEEDGKWAFYKETFQRVYEDCKGDESAIIDRIYDLRDEMGDLSDEEVSYIEDHFDELLAAVKEDLGECGSTPVMEDDMDAEIAETLRIAGVQLDEVSEEVALAGKKDLPMPPIGKANPAAKEDAKGQEPDYQEPATEKAMGYEASKGFEPLPNIKVTETVNKAKIASIMETAKHMYAKKDASEWLALDRRYVEKLLKEGVGYTNASKMLMEAKKAK